MHEKIPYKRYMNNPIVIGTLNPVVGDSTSDRRTTSSQIEISVHNTCATSQPDVVRCRTQTFDTSTECNADKGYKHPLTELHSANTPVWGPRPPHKPNRQRATHAGCNEHRLREQCESSGPWTNRETRIKNGPTECRRTTSQDRRQNRTAPRLKLNAQ